MNTNNKIGQFLVVSAAFTLLLIIAMQYPRYAFIEKHEAVHRQTCKIFNGTITNDTFNPYGISEVTCDVGNRSTNVPFLYAEQENVGYHLQAVLLTAWFMLWVLIEAYLFVKMVIEK